MVWAIAALVCSAAPARAHSGPPYPVAVDRKAGPYVVNVWADPDVGVGTFYLGFEGGKAPDEVELWVQPDDKRLPEVRTVGKRDARGGTVTFQAEAQFDTQEWWRARLVLRGSEGVGEVDARVKVTPPGLGPLDVLLYLAPFLAVGFLWLKAVLRRRVRRPV